MWSNVLAINTVIWAALGVFLVYSAGTLILHGAWRQFLLALLLWSLSNVSAAIFAILC